MSKYLISITAGLLVFIASHGQGIIRGKITDENGEPLIGATVVLKIQPVTGTIADFDGNYSIKTPSDVSVVIGVSYIGCDPVEETVSLEKNEVLIKDFILLPATNAISDVVITAKAKKSNDKYMQLVKTKSPISIDYISAETIKKTGDSNASDAIKRITGVSTIGGFVSVRGLADRYIKTAVNGLRIPTLDPITNNIKLEMFPTSLVDNIVITKTMNPDLPGDWSGSFVSIDTKDYPEKLMVNLSTTFGFNPQTSFQEIISSKKSNTDWLGFDNGYRDFKRFGYKGTFPEFYSPGNITPYEEFIGAGLGEYMNQMGFTKDKLNPDVNGNITVYHKLCLVELGLLKPGLIDDNQALDAAISDFETIYSQNAFKAVNKPSVDLSKTLPANWGTVMENPILSAFSQEAAIGNQILLFNKPLGFVFGGRYSSAIRYDPQSEFNLAKIPEASSSEYISLNSISKISTESNTWSALINLAYALSPNHNVSVLFMPNISGINIARNSINELNSGGDDSVSYGISQYYEERQQLIYQFNSNHFFPVSRLKLNFNASYTDGTSSIPDSKTLKLYPTGVNTELTYNDFDYNYKRSSYLLEDVFDSRLSLELPIGDTPGLMRKLKFGASYQSNTREAEIYQFLLSGYPNEGNFSIKDFSELNDTWSKERYNIDSASFLYYDYRENDINFVIGYSKVTAGYLMLDYAISPTFRLSGGLRFEYTDIFTDVRLFYENKYPANDPRREAAKLGLVQLPSARPGEIKHYDYLPALNLIYKVISNENTTINSRFSFSQTLARPSIREITPLYQEDFILQKSILGNPKLKMVSIDNYDLRLESFFASGDNVSASLFYKKFRNHIELVEVPYVTWQNAQNAEAYGFEIEGQKNVTKNLVMRANFALIKSYSKMGNISHPMFGQAPYIVNCMLDYTSDEAGLSAAISYNVQGPKLALIVVKDLKQLEPDIYEMPQHLIDLKVSKNIGKHFNVNFKARNILNSPIRRAKTFQDIGEIDYDNFSYGTDYSIGISYNL